MIIPLRALSWSGIFLIATRLVMIRSYLGTGSDKEASFSQSTRIVKGPLFIAGTLILGLPAPLVLFIVGIAGGEALLGLAMISGAFLIIRGVHYDFPS